MKKDQDFKRRCQELVSKINTDCLAFVTDIRYKEYLHNVYYENGICYCDNMSERRLSYSDIEKCRYKNRIQVTLIASACGGIDEWHKKQINKILKTNAEYKKLEYGFTAIIFNVNPHKM